MVGAQRRVGSMMRQGGNLIKQSRTVAFFVAGKALFRAVTGNASLALEQQIIACLRVAI